MIGAIDHDLIAEKLSAITQLSRKDLVERWTSTNKRPPPKGISRRILEYSAAYQVQVKACGGLSPTIRRKLRRKGPSRHKSSSAPPLRLSVKTCPRTIG
ncbi:MAG: DUF2924 domain-containing protein [Rhodospirillales bacterium]|nr:DUF2924 domain-containing protein [Rhodospirillales bacterium]